MIFKQGTCVLDFERQLRAVSPRADTHNASRPDVLQGVFDGIFHKRLEAKTRYGAVVQCVINLKLNGKAVLETDVQNI